MCDCPNGTGWDHIPLSESSLLPIELFRRRLDSDNEMYATHRGRALRKSFNQRIQTQHSPRRRCQHACFCAQCTTPKLPFFFEYQQRRHRSNIHAERNFLWEIPRAIRDWLAGPTNVQRSGENTSKLELETGGCLTEAGNDFMTLGSP